jgi:hypothetical protein
MIFIMALERSNTYFTQYTFPRNELNPMFESLREGGFKIKIESIGADYGVYSGEERVSVIRYTNRNNTMQMDVQVMSQLDKLLLRQMRD